MRFQKTIKNNWQKKYNNKNKLEQLIIRSNLLGQDLKITNFGGGNTSSKIISKDPSSPLVGSSGKLIFGYSLVFGNTGV